MTDKQIATYCDDVKETALKQFYKIQNQRKEISLLHKKCTLQQAEIENLQADKEALINGQETLQKEIERLQEELKTKNGAMLEIFENKSAFERIARIKAIEEFAERMKKKSQYFIGHGFAINLYMVDVVVKEMVGDDS